MVNFSCKCNGRKYGRPWEACCICGCEYHQSKKPEWGKNSLKRREGGEGEEEEEEQDGNAPERAPQETHDDDDVEWRFIYI